MGNYAFPKKNTYWRETQLFNFWGSYKAVVSASFNFYFLGFWASEKNLFNFLRLLCYSMFAVLF